MDPLIFRASGAHPRFSWIWPIPAAVNNVKKSDFA